MYLNEGFLKLIRDIRTCGFTFFSGIPESLLEASNLIEAIEKRQGYIYCLYRGDLQLETYFFK